MKEDTKGKKVINWIIRIFWILVIGSVFGFFAEMLYVMVYTRNIEIRKGLIYGPFIQIYGIGALAYYLLVRKIKEPKDVFISGMIMGGLLEYLCSFFQEILFGTISWDYSNFFMNLNGRTCLQYCVYWGIIALLFLKIVYPWLQKIEKLIYEKRVRIITVFLMIFIIYDVTISCMAAHRQQERKNNIECKNKIDTYLDNKYPDEVLDKIYHSKIEMN